VLEDAIECFMKCIDASTSKGQAVVPRCRRVIAHEDKRWVFSFDKRLRHARHSEFTMRGATGEGQRSTRSRGDAPRLILEAGAQPQGSLLPAGHRRCD